MANKVEICGVDTSKLPLYKEAEMMDMLSQIKAGNEEIREKFIRGNLRLVLSVIQRFSNRGENPDDLFQVGCIGLIKALDNFDMSHGVKFSTYAVPMIIGEVRRYLRDNNSIRVSRSLRDLAYRSLQVKEILSSELQREPTVSEIANRMETKREDVVMALESIQEPVSLFEPVFQDDGDALYVMDQVSDNKNTDIKWIENISLTEAMSKLSPRERHILNIRFFEGKTQMEVAREIGISQAQVSRLEKNALLYMRKELT
jgi:RNA polymerase sporulation-specific sigma factor